MGFPGCSMVKNPPANAGDMGLVSESPGSGRSPGGVNGNPLQYDNHMDRGAWQATVCGVTESGTTEQLSMHLNVNLLVRLVVFQRNPKESSDAVRSTPNSQ